MADFLPTLYALATDPTAVFIFYGCILSIGFLFAWLADRPIYTYLGLVGVGHWMAYGTVLVVLGFDNAPLLVGLSCLAGSLSAWIGYQAKSRVALWIVLLWLAAAVISTTFYCFHIPTATLNYLLLNATFVARWVILGGAGMVELVRGIGPLPSGARARRPGR